MSCVNGQYPQIPKPSESQPRPAVKKGNEGSGDSQRNTGEEHVPEIYSSTRRFETFAAPSPIRRYRKCDICTSTYRLGAEKGRWWRIHRHRPTNRINSIRYGPRTELAYGYGSKIECILAFFLMMFIFVAFFLTTIWITFYRNGLSFSSDIKLRFNWHPFLMVAGFVVLSGFSMLIPSLCFCLRSVYKNLFHLVLHVAVIPCIVIGTIAILDHHDMSQPSLPNFKSLHSWLGLASIGTYAMQIIFGLLRLLSYGSFGNIWIARLHKSLGTLHYVLVTVTCLTGTSEPFLWYDSIKLNIEDDVFKNCLGIVFLLTGILLITFMKFKKV